MLTETPSHMCQEPNKAYEHKHDERVLQSQELAISESLFGFKEWNRGRQSLAKKGSQPNGCKKNQGVSMKIMAKILNK